LFEQGFIFVNRNLEGHHLAMGRVLNNLDSSVVKHLVSWKELMQKLELARDLASILKWSFNI
jgi:hypothetical protein